MVADQRRPIRDLPDALPIEDWFEDPAQRVAVFLDYDGTLTPIVDDPDAAVLDDATRRALEHLAERTTVAVISGRDLDDVRDKVGIDHLAYAGSHGFDIRHADGTTRQLAGELAPALDAAQQVLQQRLAGIDGARVERKRFAIAVHDRQVDDPDDRERIARITAEVAADDESLRPTGGKRIHELRPDIDWDKGRAIAALIDELGIGDHRAVYVGDDLTDEDGFAAVRDVGGFAVVVRGEDPDRPSLAHAALEDPAATRRMLEQLATRLERTGTTDA